MSNRYDRLLELSTFSKDKLDTLNKSKVLIIGVGGVGQHIATYLVTNGVINLTIIDFDKVELSNLNRQILLKEEDINLDKVEIVKKELLSRNVDAHINAINLKADESNISSLNIGYDVVVDATDNWKSKLLISKVAKENNIVLLHVGVDGTSGQFAIFKNKSLLDVVSVEIINSKKDGVLGPMVGIISSLATINLISFLVGDFKEIDTLFSYDSLTNKISKVNL